MSKESNVFYESLLVARKKLTQRIDQGVELDKVIELLNSLVVFEYSKIRQITEPEFLDSQISIEDFGKVCFNDFALGINELELIENHPITVNKFKLREIPAKIKALYSHEFLVVRFFSSHISCFMIFGLALWTFYKVFSVDIDSSALIGVFVISVTASGFLSRSQMKILKIQIQSKLWFQHLFLWEALPISVQYIQAALYFSKLMAKASYAI